MRNRFNEELDNLNQSMKETGGLCVEAVDYASSALLNGSQDKAKEVFSIHRRIHGSERKIESTCLRLLMEQQPVASDLRMISACLKASYDLERIGEMSADIAEIICSEKVSAANDLFPLRSMSSLTENMTEDAVKALTEKDSHLAQKVIQADDAVDHAFLSAGKKIEAYCREGNGVAYGLNILMIAKYYEKIGDHAVNIAKWTMLVHDGIPSGPD